MEVESGMFCSQVWIQNIFFIIKRKVETLISSIIVQKLVYNNFCYQRRGVQYWVIWLKAWYWFYNKRDILLIDKGDIQFIWALNKIEFFRTVFILMSFELIPNL